MENTKRKLKSMKGITLVALVVTIVVLLILAGVSINMVLGENGLIAKSKEAKNAYQQDAINTEKELAELYDELQTNLGEFPSTEYTKPYLPTGFTRVEGTGLSNGLVIQDGNGNQYVWVEVPKTATVYPTAGLEITTFTEDEYTKIENDLHTYTSAYREGTRWMDTWHADNDENTDTNNNENWLSETSYNEIKKKMLKSIYQNGGFYVGRYETGIEESNRTAAGDTTQTPSENPVIKADAYPYNYVTRTQAQTLASNMTSGERTSSLMFGVQWDLVLKYLETKNAATQPELKENSTTIGNYNNNLWNITNPSAKYFSGGWKTCPYEKTAEANVLLTTGADTSFGKMNIYDMAGNVWEWTLEYAFGTTYPCARRGGSYDLNGPNYLASYRGNGGTNLSNSYIGFRVALY